jgi:hypothetical protein
MPKVIGHFGLQFSDVTGEYFKDMRRGGGIFQTYSPESIQSENPRLATNPARALFTITNAGYRVATFNLDSVR